MNAIRPIDAWAATIRGKPAIGASAERTRRTTMQDVEMFAAMTGDRNPLHFDAALAAASPFGGLIVQGGVTSGLLNAVVAEDLPGPGSVFLGVEWRVVKAVLVGEEITARVTVTAVRDDKPICTIGTVVCNGRGEPCLTGTATTYTVPLRNQAGADDGAAGNARTEGTVSAASGATSRDTAPELTQTGWWKRAVAEQRFVG
jgi:acyl dehydratase